LKFRSLQQGEQNPSWRLHRGIFKKFFFNRDLLDVEVSPVRKGRALTAPSIINKELMVSISTIPSINAGVF